MMSKWKDKFVFSVKDTAISLLFIAGAAAMCFLLRSVDDGDIYVPLIFVLAVFFISRMTNGYFYGIAASIAAVFFVNYIFTYPYYELNFAISGYPLTFLTMMAVSLITCTMTTQIKEHKGLEIETEREKTRANLLRAVSHDLRTPLTSIIGTTSAILENGDSLEREERDKLLVECREDAAWLVRMVENLLSVTKINAGQTDIKKDMEVVEEIVAEAVQKFKKHFPDQKVLVQVPEDLLLVPMDPILIEQVISNLLENAVLHSGSAGPIELVVQDKRERAYFSVRDHGVGIVERDGEALFQGFYNRDERQGADSKKNMGIGLSVCMTIIKAHQGEMWAENAKDGGAVFIFWLPGIAIGEGSDMAEEEYVDRKGMDY